MRDTKEMAQNRNIYFLYFLSWGVVAHMFSVSRPAGCYIGNCDKIKRKALRVSVENRRHQQSLT